MFRRNKNRSRIDSLISADIVIEGNIRFNMGLRIDGQVLGNVTADGEQPCTLIVSQNARIEGEVRVARLIVNGTITGTVYTSGHVELQPKSQIYGDVHYETLEMHLGAVVDGRLMHILGEIDRPPEEG